MSLDVIADIIRSRRTHMLVDTVRAVPHRLVNELCELAQWAPNHKRTWPAQFALVEGDGRARLGDAISNSMEPDSEEDFKIAKARGKYVRTPATLVVGSAPGDSPLRTAENRDAVAAGIQNILLAATAVGLATFWSSCATGAHESVSELCGFKPDSTIVGLVYLGWPVNTVATPQRPGVQLNIVD